MCTPVPLPREVVALDSPVDGLAVGSVGKVGLLQLVCAPVNGITRVMRRHQHPPLQLVRAFHPDSAHPEMAFLYLLSSGGGIVQGDRLRVDLVCEPGAAVHVTTQAATKVYGMAQNFATQWINITVQAGALVEYMPDPVIPFAGARFYQQTRLWLDPAATLLYGETIYPGRVAFAERHAYTLFYSHCEAATTAGELLFADVLKFHPQQGPVHSPGLLGQHDYISTFYVVTSVAPARTLARHIHTVLGEPAGAVVGISELPGGCGVIVRLLARSSQVIHRALQTAWGAARLFVTGRPLPAPRKY